MTAWIAVAVRLVPVVISLFQGAEQAFPEPGSGEQKKKLVADIAQPAVPDAPRELIGRTIDVVVEWLKLFGKL